MESFRAALDRLTKKFVSELFATVSAAAIEQLAAREPPQAGPKPVRIIRSNAGVTEATPVVVRKFEIPVGQPRRRRRQGTPGTYARKPAPSPEPKVVKFEVVPHPEQKNRRIVLTRLSSE
jgi:hypothetical protein